MDFGQNHTGWLRFRSRLPKGCEVHFDFGEVLQQGNFYNANYHSATGHKNLNHLHKNTIWGQRSNFLSIHIDVPFGCVAAVTLPRSETVPFVLPCGSYDYRYAPSQDYRAVYTLDSRLSTLLAAPGQDNQ